jgi:hypothetical protein
MIAPSRGIGREPLVVIGMCAAEGILRLHGGSVLIVEIHSTL